MAQKRKPFDKLFAQLQDIRDKDGKLLNTVLWSQKGNPSVFFEIENPVQQYCTDADQYRLFQDVLANIVKTLGEGYALQKQDIFCKQEYTMSRREDRSSSPRVISTTSRDGNIRTYAPSSSSRRNVRTMPS